MRILIADDQEDVISALELLLKNEGYLPVSVTSPAGALEQLGAREFDIVLLDLNYARDTTSGSEGLELLARIRQIDPDLPIVLMTAWGSVELAVEALQRGARDFVLKPWDNHKLLEALRRQARGRPSDATEIGRRRWTREMAEARLIQERLLPGALPQTGGCEIHAEWRPAGNVGGDYYDVIEIHKRRLAFLVGDVSGKGLGAALLMSNTQAAVRALAKNAPGPADVCRQVNRIVSENVGTASFVTLFYGVLDLDSRTLDYTNAGHIPPFLVSRAGQIQRLSDGGTFLGPFPEAVFEQRRVGLDPGDRLVLITDGISEAEDSRGEPFGEERLIHLLGRMRTASSKSIGDAVTAAVASHAGSVLADDLTIMVVSIHAAAHPDGIPQGVSP